MRRALGVAVVRAVGVLAVVLLVHVVLDSLGPVAVPIPALMVGGLAVLAAVDLIAAARPPTPTHARIGEGEVSGFGYPRARHWQERLDVAKHDAGYFAGVVVPELRQLADERLRAVHNIDRHDHPDRARELLGPRVWALLWADSEPARRPTVGQLSAVIDDLEAL